MIFTHWLTETLIISRMVATSGDKTAMSTVTATTAQLQPLDDERSSLAGGVYGKTFKIWVDTTTAILEGDKLKDTSGTVYIVKKGGVTSRSMGSISYKEIIIEETS